MTTRFNAKSKTKFGVSGLSSGYDGVPGAAPLAIPSVGIEDADIALFNLFDKEIPFNVSTSDKSREELKKVPVIFASAEKWALAKRQKAIRDRSGSLILPLITVVRTTIQQSSNEDIAGRGINQQTGEITIQRRLDKIVDRSYQNLINRSLIEHQLNLAVHDNVADVGQVTTDRLLGDNVDSDGALLKPNRRSNNVYETITIPAPQFYTAMYDVTFWAQYTVQMFQMMETLISSFLPQGNTWRLDTPKGYWFMATVDGNNYNVDNNVDDMSSEERIIKHKFTVKVPGYILASAVPGAPVPIKRYVSSPSISFDVGVGSDEQLGSETIDDPYLGSDDPTLPLELQGNRRDDQRLTNGTRLFPNPSESPEDDPARKSLPRGQSVTQYKKVTTTDYSGRTTTKNVRVTSTNRFTGETVFSQGFDLGALSIVVD